MRDFSYPQAVRYIESLIRPDAGRRARGTLRLERIEHLLRLVGNPERTFRSIHIGGTSGKGSTAYIAAAILKEAGTEVGLHVSPHLERINERMQVNLQPISDRDFARLVTWIKPYVEKVASEGDFGRPSYFEALVALSFEYFRRKRVRVAVVEVGLGGTKDATNVIRPDVAVITNVSLDHTEILGKTIERIARDKAGIVKKGIDVITAAEQKSVLEIIKTRCRKNRARLTVIGSKSYSVVKHDLTGLRVKLRPPGSRFLTLGSRLTGRHQAENIALAIAAVGRLGGKNKELRITNKTIAGALQKLTIPGRLEIMPRDSLLSIHDSSVILDGAHNPAKVRALATALKELFPKQKFIFIFAAKKNKDIHRMLKALAPLAEKFYFTRFGATTDFGRRQSTPPETLAAVLKEINPHIPVGTSSSPAATLRKIRDTRYIIPDTSPTPACLTGSLYLVGEARGIIKP